MSVTQTQHSGDIEATIVFADISGFTAVSERLDPEAVTELMNRCFAALEGVVLAHGGHIDKYLGDCVVAAFGLGEDATPPSAARAVQAALEVRGAVRALAREVPAAAALDIHVGIATGHVFAGEVGGVTTRVFTVRGEAVELAAHMEDVSETGQILVSDRTHAETSEVYEYRAPAVPVGDGPPVHELVGMLRSRRRVRRPSERREATIVFADLMGFDALAAERTPEAMRAFLNRCFEVLEGAVHDFGGVVDKYIGEGVMALFGVPNAIERAPHHALNASIEMRRRLAEFATREGLRSPLGVHIGVNTGLVIAGEMGGRARRAFTVMGDVVNLAARLKAAAPGDAVYVGPETYRQTQGEFEFSTLPPLRLKGKAEPVPARELRSATAQLHRTRTDTAAADRLVAAPLVGREEELGTLRRAAEGVCGGRGGIVSIVGEPGIGKSRLVLEFRSLAILQGATVLEARSVSTGQARSYHPFADLLRRWAHVRATDDEHTIGAALERAVRTLLPDEIDEVFPFLATLMGIRLQGAQAERVEEIQGEALEEMIFRGVQKVLRQLAEERPLVLVFEDLSWADQSSVSLLESLLRLVTRVPLLIIAIGRPEFPDTFDRIRDHAREHLPEFAAEIVLTHLTDQQCDALIQHLLQVDDLPYATRALIIRKAEGNPFYIEEVVRSLIDQGAVVMRDGRYRLTERIESVVIPGTIREVIMTRVDRLDEAVRQVLQVAAVIGRFFHYRLLAAILADEGDLEAHLRELEERQFVLVRGAARGADPAGRQYVFQHALVQDSVYEAMLQRTRKAMHHQVATSIETTFADRLTEFFGMLAYHYSRSEEAEKAEHYLFKAGEEAARAAASAEALNFFREASRIYMQLHGAGGDPQKKALLEKNIALALLNTGAITESINHFDQSLVHMGEPVPTTAVGRLATFVGNFARMGGYLYAGIAPPRRVDDWDREREVCFTLFNRGRAEITSDPTRLFFDAVSGVVRLAHIDAARIDQASAMYASCAGVFCYSGISFPISRRVLDIANRFVRPGNVRDLLTVGSMEFVYDYLLGDWSDHHVLDEALLDEALRHGQLWDVNTYVGLYCDRLLRQGTFRTARKQLERLADMSDSYGFTFAGGNHDGMKAILLAEERKLPEALRQVDVYQGARHEDALKVLGLGTRAKILALLGEADAAHASLADAEKITRRSREIPPWHLSAYAVGRLRADLALLGGRPGDRVAERNLKRSVRYALGIAAKVAVQRTEIHQLAGQAAWAFGRRRRAFAEWDRAIEVGTQLGARPELARTYAVVADAADLGGGGRRTVDGLDAAGCHGRASTLFAELGLSWDQGRVQVPGRAA